MNTKKWTATRLASVAMGAAMAMSLASCSWLTEGPLPDQTPLPETQVAAPEGVNDPATDPAFAAFYQQTPEWKKCEDGPRDPAECLEMTVPVDWDEPSGPTLKIWVGRVPASSKDKRLGALVFNPGGPGVEAVDYLDYADFIWGRPVRALYDQVTFDPRGIGRSSAVQCLDAAAMDEYLASDASPDDEGEIVEAQDWTKRFADACAQNTDNKLLENLDTVSVAKDMDVLRAVLEQEVLVYHGVSYGTYLGSWYAELFPWRVGRLVLDAAVDPSLTNAEYAEGQAQGFNRALRAFLKDCLKESDCPVRGTVDEAEAQITRLVELSDENPLSTKLDDRVLTQSLMNLGIGQALYAVDYWPALRQALKAAFEGDGTALLELSDSYVERDENGEYGGVLSSNPAIYCLDFPESRTLAEIEAEAARLGPLYPPMGDAIGWAAIGCQNWPLRSENTARTLTAAGADPILVVGTRNDPATPYEWAEGLAGQLESGVLLTWEGNQHSAYKSGSACIDEAVEAYLISATLPDEGTVCP